MTRKKLYSLLGLTVLGYAFLEPYWHKIKKYEIEHKQIPENFDGFKIAFLADIHFGRQVGSKKLEKMVKEVNRWGADVVILGGDYIMHKRYIYPCFKELAKLKSKYGTYAVMGNHDVTESLADTRRAMRISDIKNINNAAFWIKHKGQKIRLGGVGDLRTQNQHIEPTIKNTRFEDYIILVTHNPRYLYQIKDKYDINLVLAGHTHGGQFSPLKHLSKIVPAFVDEAIAFSYLSGQCEKDGRDVIVSNGIGTAKFPLRIMTRPEMVYITLRPSKKRYKKR
ncbi:MAG: hypothetical protein BEN18_04540 [Epulopiscium sp. Nuni2H_MBin001]|nr:MAG: hypothetical protein BEN18_04540 [Epulopiscium sp. Nuni2H_MBin001]